MDTKYIIERSNIFKNFRAIFLSISLCLATNLYGHSVQVGYTVCCTGVTIFLEHWHGMADPLGATITIKENINGVETTVIVSPSSIMHAALADLTTCSNSVSSFGSCPGDANVYNDWIVYHIPNLPCGVPIIITVLSGDNAANQEGCTMFPASTPVITVPCNPIQPILLITNPTAVCFPNAIDITTNAVTAGSTGGGTLSYWIDSGATNGLSSPNSLLTSGTNYIKVTATGGCTDIKPVTITVNPLPVNNAGNDLSICPGINGSIGSAAVPGNTYSWNPSTGLSDTTVSNPANTTINSTSTPIVTPYTLTTIITATGCQATDNAVITVNPQPVLAIISPAAVCFPNTVDITTADITTGSTGGATLTYWTDAGATNFLSSPNAIATSGTNYIKITDNSGCTDIKAVVDTVNPQPNASFTTQDESSSLYCDGSIEAVLTGGTGTIQNQWLDFDQTVLSITDYVGGLCAGIYTLQLIDSNSCTNTYTQAIQSGLIPATAPICLVTVDSTLTHNLLVWEKTNLNMVGIDSFVVYREFGANIYLPIGAVPQNSLSTFTDLGANPASTGYRYKLTSKNIHGVESLFSDFHNTIYLTNNGANFSWTQYQIENTSTPVSTYNVYRDDNSTGNFQTIGFTSGNQFGYTDVNFASYPNAQYYVEAVMTEGACNPTRSSYSGSRSNVKHFGISGVQQLNKLSTTNIYPNPANNELTITGITDNTTIRLYDLVGKLVIEKEVENNTTVYTSTLTAGVYTLLTESKTVKSFYKVVISR